LLQPFESPIFKPDIISSQFLRDHAVFSFSSFRKEHHFLLNMRAGRPAYHVKSRWITITQPNGLIYFDLDSRGSLVKGSPPRFVPFPTEGAESPEFLPPVTPVFDSIPDFPSEAEQEWPEFEDMSSHMSSPFTDAFMGDMGGENDEFGLSFVQDP
jgi:hypothetical protein